jgi:hypothetical protein
MIEQVYEELSTCSVLYEDLSITIGACESAMVRIVFTIINGMPDWVRFAMDWSVL